MTLRQNGQLHTVEQLKSKLHLDESNGTLKLYVPNDESDRELCYLQHLPKRLLRFLSISDPAAEAVISAIMNSSRFSVVDEILKDAGIFEIEGIERLVEVDEDEQEWSDVATSSVTENASANNVLTPSQSTMSSERHIDSESTLPRRKLSSSDSPSSSSLPGNRALSPSPARTPTPDSL